jgi:hypothetical protein
MRYANHFLPDSRGQALLRCKLSATAAMEAARWLEPAEPPARRGRNGGLPKPITPSRELRSRVRSRMIAFARS